jgi:hypothetical protein
MKAWEMNIASRVIGFLVRIVVIAVALIILVGLLAIVGFGLALWVITPFLVIILPLLGVGRLFA